MSQVIAMKKLLSGRHLAQAVVAAGLALLVGCHLPVPGRGSAVASRANLPDVVPAAFDRSVETKGEGIILEIEKGAPLGSADRAVAPPETADAGAPQLPEALVGKPYGGVTVAIKWPQIKTGPYRTQVIPASAKSIRIRVVGSDGTDRLAVMFFRDESSSNSLVQRQTFFLPVEPGLLVEARAYEATRAGLTEVAADKRAKFNPAAFKHYDMASYRVLAEGFAFNQQIVLLKETRIKVDLDTSQLVAGIGGQPGISAGGDPYFNNFVSRARFAELWSPAFVHFDPYARRLFWVEFPVFKTVPDPKERDIVRMLTPAGVTGTENPGVLVWSVGGDRIIERNGDNNPPDCAEIKNVTSLSWSGRGGGSLYIAQTGNSGFLSSVRKLSPASGAGRMGSITEFRADSSTSRNFPNVSAAIDPGLNSGDDVFTVDTIGKRAMISRSESPFPILLGGGTVSVEATSSTSTEAALLTDPRAIAGKSKDDFAIINGNTVVRAVGTLARIKAGGGTNPANNTVGVANVPASAVALGTLIDIEYDPVNLSSGGPVAYVAASDAVWRLQLGAALTADATATLIASYSAAIGVRSIATDPDGNAVYVLKSSGKIDKISSAAGTPALAELPITAFSNSTAIAAGSGTGGDTIFVASLAPGSAAQIISSFREDATSQTSVTTLFGQVDRNELSVGDCTDFVGQLNVGGNPVSAATFRITGSGGEDPEGAANLTKPSWLASDKFGYLYISDTGNNRIRRVHFNDNHAPDNIVSLVTAKNLDSKPARLDAPQGVDADEYGNAFICDTNTHQIVVWRPCDKPFTYDRGLLNIAGTGKNGLNFDNINARLVQLNGPKAVRVEQNPKGNPSRRRVYFIDQGKRIRMLTPRNLGTTQPALASRTAGSVCPSNDDYFDYIISTIAGAGSENPDLNVNAANVALEAPVDLAVDSAGYVYVADGSKVRRIDPIVGSISTIYRAPNALTSISIDAATKELYFTMQNSVSIRKVFLGE
ncbi:MAG: hypothetical protein FJZ01_03275 [Candidatus Sericytochromatia bacterium]|nr:hypothetical protein [Candidatus Tanganyikabacteria bacterium]